MVKKRWRNIEVEREHELDSTILLIELHEKLDKILGLLEEIRRRGGGGGSG